MPRQSLRHNGRDPQDVRDTQASYDTIAAAYTEHVRDELTRFPLGRALLAYFAEMVRSGGGGAVLEVGCGPGRITAHLAGLGLEISGIDLSPAMVEIARREHPGLRFEVGDLAVLPHDDDALAGVVSWYSVIHTPPSRLPEVFEELMRVLRPGGLILLAFQTGDEPHRRTELAGHPVTLTFHRNQVDDIVGCLRQVGLHVVSHAWQEQREEDRTPQGFVLARRPRAA